MKGCIGDRERFRRKVGNHWAIFGMCVSDSELVHVSAQIFPRVFHWKQPSREAIITINCVSS